ncbi:MAG TPA: aminotransferase class V-fold PLP-dependent enzyme [Humisphaera sp.]
MPTLSPPAPLAPNLRDLWQLKPGIAFLNHGSFGAVPRAVAATQNEWRAKIEAEPIELLGRKWWDLIRRAVEPVGRFLNASADDLGFVTNATEGCNCVLRSLRFKAGDELLTTTHVYHAVRQAMKHRCAETGATYREVDVPLPIRSAEQIVDAVVAGLRPETKLLVVDHVTSPTALVFPIEPIAAACRERGVDLLVDAAHAPGQLSLDLADLGRRGVSFYTGNLHKWCCAPKGTAVLWAHPDREADLHPLVVSHWYGEGLFKEFGWQGTRDHSAWLTAGAAIDYLGQWGWDAVRAHNHALAIWAHRMLCDRFGVEPVSPPDGSLLGSMATVPLPPPLDAMTDAEHDALQQALYTDHGVEVPLVKWGGRRFLRVSAQVYNVPAEYERVGDVVLKAARG